MENYAAQVARAVRESGEFDVVVLTTGTGLRTRRERHEGVPVLRMGVALRLSNTPVNPLWAWQVRRRLRRLRVDAVHAHAPVPGLGDCAVLFGGRPAVFTYHAGSMDKGAGQAAANAVIAAYERFVLPRVFRRSRAVVAVSPVSLAARQPGAIHISPGVDTEVFTPGKPAGSRPPVVVYVGRMDRSSSWKGVHVLIEAMRELTDVPGARLRLIGGGDAVPDHRELAERLGVSDRVEFVGELKGQALASAVAEARALVLPSLSEAESFGMTLAEGMACATPVIGSRVGGIPFVLEEGANGIMVEPGDAGALARACRAVLTDDDLADRMGARGAAVARERFAWNRLTDRYLELFRELTR
ncbi:glycosyltransferase family 4 protein [Streptomyces sp. NPDC003487]